MEEILDWPKTVEAWNGSSSYVMFQNLNGNCVILWEGIIICGKTKEVLVGFVPEEVNPILKINSDNYFDPAKK